MAKQAPLLAPNPINDTTSGVPWSPSYTGTQRTTRTVGPTGASYTSGPGGQQIPRATPEDPYAEVRWWNMYESDLTDRALKEQNAFHKKQLEDARTDAATALKQAKEIAELTDRTSRYGTDVASRDRLAALEVNQEQFRATHQLAQQQFGLDYAKAATEYLSTPDRYFQAGDFIDMAGRALQGNGPQPYGATGTPQPKQYGDFYALSSYGQGGGQGQAGAAAAAGGAGTDPRQKALKAVFDAIPPSGADGLTGNDQAALNAARAIYSTNLAPGTVERMRPGQQAMLASAGKRLGFDPNDWLRDYKSYGVGQGSVRQA